VNEEGKIKIISCWNQPKNTSMSELGTFIPRSLKDEFQYNSSYWN